MSDLTIKKDFIKFDFIKNSIKIVYSVLHGREVPEKQLGYLTALFICKLEGKPFVSETCLNIFKKNVSSKSSRTDISNYISLLKDKELIGYEDKEVKFPGTFRYIGKETFNLKLTSGIKE